MLESLIIPLLIVPMASVALAQRGVALKAMIYPRTWHLIKMRPIDCAFCLSFWINVLGCQLTLPGQHWYFVVLFALASAIMSKKVEDIL